MEQKPECNRWEGQQLLLQQMFKKVFHFCPDKSLDTEEHMMKTMTLTIVTMTATNIIID
jgi:hypothetical protein